MNHSSRYFIDLSYNGARYCGWQNQPNGISVQHMVEESLAKILRRKVAVTGAGRTDAGVHAKKMVAHFDLTEGVDPEALKPRLNKILPPDIAIRSIREVNPEAHARFDALSRTYTYYVVCRKDPFDYPFSCVLARAPELEAMNSAARILFDYIDFTSFSKLHTDVKTNNCRIMKAAWSYEEEGQRFLFTIQADRFLRNMVRAIVGTLLDVGRGKLSPDGFRKIIEAKDRCKAGTSAPAHALFLADIEYPDSVFTLPHTEDRLVSFVDNIHTTIKKSDKEKY